MTRTIIILGALLVACTSFNTEHNKISNLQTFSKAYGYVKYFHPSDEAATVDWKKFAAFGAAQMMTCSNTSEVITMLNSLFRPIAPSVVFSKEKQEFDLQSITPQNITQYQPTYWQHRGVSKDMNNQSGTYSSVRVNRDSEVDESASFGNLMQAIDFEKCIGKEIKFTAWVKRKEGSEGSGHLWLRVDKSDKTRGFFDNMAAQPIKSKDWAQYEIIGEVDTLASNVVLGFFMLGKGTLYIDDVHIYYKENDAWIEMPIQNSDFEAAQIGIPNEESQWVGRSKGYSYNVSDTHHKGGEQSAVITYEGLIRKTRGVSIFDASPKFGEIIEKEIGDGIFCQIPLHLYGNLESTYPKAEGFSQLQENLINMDDSPSHLSVRLGNVINTYNVFQHFYPYFNEVGTNWGKEFEKALQASFDDQTDADHLITMQKFTAPLRDGHIRVSGNAVDQHVPPIKWEWIENKLVITAVRDQNLNIEVGDIVTRINDQSPEEYFKEFYSRISAGTKGWLDYQIQTSSILGKKDSELILEVNNETLRLKRDKTITYGNSTIAIQKNNYKLLEENIYYLNLSTIPMDTITRLLPQLTKAIGIICDLRGYPNSNHGLISHLLAENDTSKTWMQIPKIIYPDQEKITGYETYGWELEAKKPYLGDKKVVFIIDGRAISYAESYMGFIKDYNLATIVGQPSAGTNGNINPFTLLGNHNITWTGMKVVKHDGSQHHAIGVLPDIYVDKTIEGVRSGRDEMLEKAIEVVLE